MGKMLFFLVFFVVLAAVFYWDLVHRVIPNKLILVLATVTIVFNCYTNNLQQMFYAPLFLLVGLIFWRLNVFAGGDVKLVTALLPAINNSLYLDLFVLTMFLWGATAVLVMLYHRIRTNDVSKTVPFGVPMAIGGVIGLFASL